MEIKALRSDYIYEKIMQASENKKNDIYRYEMMGPFSKKWDCYNIPLKAKLENGYDVITASDMLGFLSPKKITEDFKEDIKFISNDLLWYQCREAIIKSFEEFEKYGVQLKVKEYLFTLLLADPDNPYTILNDGYCGDGGIPGYILGSLTPNPYTLKRIPTALVHECNHNVRFQFQKWRNDITLGGMMIVEGIAENFVAQLCGEDSIGPWVTKTDMETLNDYIKPIMKDVLDVSGFENITSYLYGDEMAQMQGYFPVGMPYCAGYACGYHMIKHYLKKTKKNIVEVTLLPEIEIIKEISDFWHN